MRISIVTPVRNEPRLWGALASVFDQQDAEIESIVVDSTSDGTSEAARKHWGEPVARWMEAPADGIYRAMNRGVEAATGEVVGILNADDWYATTEAVAAAAGAFADPNVEIAIGGVVFVNDRGRVVRRWPAREPTAARLRSGWMPAHPAAFVRRDTYERHGLYDPSYPVAADYELLFRLLFERRVPTAVIPQALVCQSPGGHSNGSAAAIARGAAEVARVWEASGRSLWGPVAAACKLARHAGQLGAATCLH